MNKLSQRLLPLTGKNQMAKAVAFLITFSFPVSFWYYEANRKRQQKLDSITSQTKVPNVQTIDELMIENFQPGDVVLFDRRCYTCCYSPFSSLSCFLSKVFLCKSTTHSKTLDGCFEHAGILVPSKKKTSESTDLLILEAIASEGIIARPLLQRLQSSQSRSILVLPLNIPGERRTDNHYTPSLPTLKIRQKIHEKLYEFSKTWVSISQKQRYQCHHTSLTIFGSLIYALNVHNYFNIPVSPSAWLITLALMDINAIRKGNENIAMSAKVHDFINTNFFLGINNILPIRPGWKFGKPIIVRQN